MKLNFFLSLLLSIFALALIAIVAIVYEFKYSDVAMNLFVGVLLITLILILISHLLLVKPIFKIIRTAHIGDKEPQKYFISEYTRLSESFVITFRSMWLQTLKLEEALAEAHTLDQILRTIADVNQQVVSAESVDELIQSCCDRLSQHEGYGLSWIGLMIDNEIEVKGVSNNIGEVIHPSMRISMLDNGSFWPSIQAIRHNEIVMLNHLSQDHSLDAWKFIASEENYGSFIALPLLNKTEVFGVLSLYAIGTQGFGAKEVDMLRELAGDIGFAIHAHSQKEALNRHLSVDSITSLPNRISLIDRLSLNKITALALINIDRFSDINDVYGVRIGDQLLAGYGYWLKSKIEKTSGITLYKMGSDEYALVFDLHQTLEDGVSFSEYLIDKTEEESFTIEGIELIVTITIGFATQSEKVLEHANRALKQGKIDRRKFCIFTPSLGEKKEQEANLKWYKELKEALEEERIVPYFQPIVDTKTTQIIKYEALIRLVRSDGSIVSPVTFLEIAKKIRLYGALTKVMVNKVFFALQSSMLPISINLSSEDMIDAELANYIEDAILRFDVGQKVIFEILESEGITNYLEVSTFIERFKQIGCSFAIDDFGSGYSNFDHLLRLNIDILKIDGSLIKNLPHDKNAQIIVRHICDFAHEMGIGTIAEFVASPEIYQKVVELGIDAAQGYYFYEPLPSIEL